MKGQTTILASQKQREIAVRLVLSAPHGSVCNISAPRRTNDQNAKMHAMLSDLSRAKPEGREHDVTVWKSLLMAEAGFQPLFERSLDGRGLVPIGFKSSRLSKAEFSDLIEAIYAYGAQHDVQWSDEQ